MNIDLSKRIITFLPGSRKSEIHYMLPIFISVIRKLEGTFDDLEIVIPVPLHISKLVKQKIKKAKINVKVVGEEELKSADFQSFKYALFSLSALAVATSGSVTLELARSGTPMITAYRSGYAFEFLLKRVVTIDSANLINIISDTKTVPEFLFEKCNANNICGSIFELLNKPELLLEQKELQIKVLQSLLAGTGGPSQVAAKTVLGYI